MFDRADIKWMRSELNKLAQLLGPMHKLIINEGPDPWKVVKVSFLEIHERTAFLAVRVLICDLLKSRIS